MQVVWHLTVADLKKYCKSHDIACPPHASKEDLVKLIMMSRLSTSNQITPYLTDLDISERTIVYPAGTTFYRTIAKGTISGEEVRKFQQGRPMWFHFHEKCWKPNSKNIIVTFQSLVPLRLLDVTKLKDVLRRRIWTENERDALTSFLPKAGSRTFSFIGYDKEGVEYRALRAARALCRLGWDGWIIKSDTIRCFGEFPHDKKSFWTSPEIMICRPSLVLYKV